MIPRNAKLLYQSRLDEVASGDAFVITNLPEHRLFYLDLYAYGEDPDAAGSYYPAIRLNSDSAGNYNLVTVNMGTIALDTSDITAQTYFQLGSAMSAAEAAHMTAVITGKANAIGAQLIHTESDTNGSGSGDSHITVGSWASGEQVTTITIFAAAGLPGNFGYGTIVKLYGVK